MSFLISRDRLDDVIPLCRELSERVGGQGVSFMTEIAAIGVNFASPEDAPGTLAEVFSALAASKVNIEIINSTQDSAICIVNRTKAQEGLDALKRAFA